MRGLLSQDCDKRMDTGLKDSTLLGFGYIRVILGLCWDNIGVL